MKNNNTKNHFNKISNTTQSLFPALMLGSALLVTSCGGGSTKTAEVTTPNKNDLNEVMANIKEVDRLRYFKEINADKARKNFNLTGKDITVTIVGEIVDTQHPEISNRVKKQFNTYTQKGVATPGDGNQAYKFELFGKNDGHGTHIAGTIAAECDGVGIQGVACGSTLEVYDIGAYGNERIPLKGWGNVDGFEQIIVAFSTALNDVTQRHSSRILTGSFNIEAPAIVYETGGELENKSITQILQRFEQDVDNLEDLTDKGLVTFENESDMEYLDRVFSDNGSDKLTILGTLLPKSKQWKELESAIKSYQDADGIYIITESNNLFENRTSVLNAMPSLSDKVNADQWISAVLAQPKGLYELLTNPETTNADLDAIIAKGEYITPINSCGEMAKDYCILIPSYEVLSTMTSTVAFDGTIYELDGRDYQVQTGHSMGAPMIAAALALMEEYNKKRDLAYSMKDLVRILKENANRSFLGYDESKHGKGLLDITAALNAM